MYPRAVRPTLHYGLLALLVFPGSACVPPGTGIRTYEDPFAGRTRAFVVHLDGGHLTAVGATHTRASTKLEVTVVDPSVVRTSVPAETAVAFRLGEQTLSLTTEAESPPVVGSSQDSGTVTQWHLSLPLTREQAARFGAAPLRSFSLEIGGFPRQVTVPESHAQTLRDNMQAVLSGD